MYLGTPQIIYIITTFLGLGIALSEHGKPKKGNNNAWTSIIATIITYTLLFYGGFFINK